MARLTASDAGLAMIKRFEGFLEEGLQMPDGQWLIGHGHLRMSPPEGKITVEEAHNELQLDLVPYEELLHARVTAPLSQAQFDALVSFAFSIGLAAFERSDVLRRLNAGDVIGAAVAMDAWRKTRLFGEAQVLDALVRRRAAERALLLEGDADVGAPSALVRPQIDHAAAILTAPKNKIAMPALPEAMAAAVASEEIPPEPVAADPVAQRIAGILAAEPATAVALAPAPVMTADAEDEPMDEPVSEAQDKPQPQPQPQAQAQAAAPVAATRAARPTLRRRFAMTMDMVALLGLLVLGLGLLALAGLAVGYGEADGGGALTAAAFGAPGALAVAMAVFYLVKGSPRDHA